MASYLAPVAEMAFILREVLDLPSDWARLHGDDALDGETAQQILEEAGRFASDVVGPLNGPADLEGAHWSPEGVTTPAGYPQAWQSFVEGGWPALACHPEDGGQGLPPVLDAALYEMLAATNHAWTMYPGLLHGAYECLRAHGSAELRARYCGKLASGEWLATMNLTEPQAGSDLGLLRTRAEPCADGRYAINGNKIFISGGDQDMTPNIVHLVLARLPDAPPGSRGISLFLAPKWLPDGQRNAIVCTGIEKKMGIKGSATCQMSFEGATAWLVGSPHRGLAAMFVMMNAARLHVAMQGLGHAEAARQNAADYCAQRLQMRSVGSGTSADRADPIAGHPAVARELDRLETLVHSQRVLAYWAAHLIDVSHADPDADARAQADRLAQVLTPILKAFFTDNGFDLASRAQQLFGGYGYIHDYGIEQTVRDSRIARVYEGTNEIQAIDLVLRKLRPDGGAQFGLLMQTLRGWIADDGAPETQAVLGAGASLQDLASAVLGVSERQAHAVAVDFLRACGLVMTAFASRRSAQAAQARADQDASRAQRLQRQCAFHVRYLLPEAALAGALVRAALEDPAYAA